MEELISHKSAVESEEEYIRRIKGRIGPEAFLRLLAEQCDRVERQEGLRDIMVNGLRERPRKGIEPELDLQTYQSENFSEKRLASGDFDKRCVMPPTDPATRARLLEIARRPSPLH